MRYELKIDRSELIDGLEKLRKLAKKGAANMKAMLTFEEGMLVISLNGVTVKASAEGDLPGTIRLPSKQALDFAQVLPSGDPLTLALDEGRLCIGQLSIPCAWQEAEPNPILLPMNPSIKHLLGLRFKHSQEEIARSGLMKRLEEAETVRKTLELKAVKVLEPLGVSYSEVQQLVENCLKGADVPSTSDRKRPPTLEELAAQELAKHQILHDAGKCHEDSVQHKRFVRRMVSWM